jgi:hypothetical protein
MGQETEQLIKFKYMPDNMFVPPIVPASEALPGWYKNMPYGEPQSLDGALTVKACLPFFDAMTQGYIIPLWADMFVSTEKNENGGPIFSWKNIEEPLISPHLPEQTENLPLMEKARGNIEKQSFKFDSPWLIQTPEGYSTLFTSPLNNVNPKFSLVSAIVATDTYPSFINFPFVWTGPPDWEGLVPMGTPLVQLIPFKRDNFRHEIGAMNDEDSLRHISAKKAMVAKFAHVYKNLWRKMTKSV